MSFGFGFALPAYPLRGGGGNNPFNQLGPTLDLSFTGVVTDLTDPNGYTLNTDFIIPQYQIAAQYVVWETGVGLVDKTFSQIITFTRASIGTYFDSAGVLQTATSGTPRFDYDPVTLAPRGFLIEEARTNSIRNNTMQGAVAGTPGTVPTNWAVTTTGGSITRTIVGTGTENGIAYIDIQYVFSAGATATVQFEQGTQIAAANGQTWTQSTYVKLAGGSLTNISEVRNTIAENNAGGTFLAGSLTAFTPTTGALSGQRYTHTRTLNNASTAFVVSTTQIVATGAADITLRIGLPQLEQGAFATSVIPTTTAAVPRSADTASVNTLSPWFNSTASTLYAEWTNIASAIPTGVTQVTAEIGEVTANNFYRIFTSQLANAKSSQQMFSGGVNPGRIDSGGAYSNATVKAASAFAAADRAISANGAAATTSAVGPLPVGVTTFGIGTSVGGGNSVNGWLRRIVYYPRRLTNDELRTITLPAGATITTQDYSLDTNFVGNTVAIGS